MKLIPEWKSVLIRAHSMWAFFLSLILLVAPDAIYLIWGVDTNPRLWWVLGLAALIYGIAGRLTDQGIDRIRMRSPYLVALLAVVLAAGLSWGDIRLPAPTEASSSTTQAAPAPAQAPDRLAATMAYAEPLVARWEGERLVAYRDPVGIWTVCFGETDGVKPGDSYSQAECRAMLRKRLAEFRAGLHGYFTLDTINTRLPPTRDAAFTSFAYNVGIHGAGTSTATRRLNADRIAGACEALTWWNKAGGRVLRGLVARRADERDLCMRGLA